MSVALQALGQAGFILRGAGRTVVIDPYLSDSIQDPAVGPRRFPPPVAAALAGVDLVLVTHDHADHLDPATLEPLLAASPAARVMAPTLSCGLLREQGIPGERIVPARCDETVEVAGVTVHALPSAHYTFEPDGEGRPRFLGYVVTLAGLTVYHAGDTIIYDGMLERLRRHRIDVGLLPINGRDWPREQQDLVGNLDSVEALYLAREAGMGLLVPCHYDLFARNGVNPAFFVDCLYRDSPGQRFKLMQPGETILLTA